MEPSPLFPQQILCWTPAATETGTVAAKWELPVIGDIDAEMLQPIPDGGRYNNCICGMSQIGLDNSCIPGMSQMGVGNDCIPGMSQMGVDNNYIPSTSWERGEKIRQEVTKFHSYTILQLTCTCTKFWPRGSLGPSPECILPLLLFSREIAPSFQFSFHLAYPCSWIDVVAFLTLQECCFICQMNHQKRRRRRKQRKARKVDAPFQHQVTRKEKRRKRSKEYPHNFCLQHILLKWAGMQ